MFFNRMGTDNERSGSEMEKMLLLYKSFMARVTKFDEATSAGSRFLVSFQQGLEVHTCVLGLHSLVNTAKTILIELEGLLEDVIKVLEAANEYLLPSQDEDIDARLMGEATNADEEETASSDSRRPELTEYATMMGVIYSMIKQDFVMQEKIVSALNLKLSSGELETYCTIWSLRPFIDDEIMHQAWSFIP
ncbi:uncharacterized protein LOC115685264 isoform X3 [Syzygium oleosum]|uniref:uncharacterized protein LOC115685264 isoform X3 n=1 Tax=Syzygium oleosum TaxID=219896 RepID=UPI0024BACC90|nr:uncharacterized protein LOC115685264 isoform X3 [Syzygium oleosum]